jgi:hypothetical protein
MAGLSVWSALAMAAGPREITRSPGKGQSDVVHDDVPVMVIPAGPHYLTTEAWASQVIVDLPGDFFFRGSAAVNQIVPLQGAPIGIKPARKDGFEMRFARLVGPGKGSGRRVGGPDKPYDTVMVQQQDAVLPDIGSQATVDLKLSIVRMRSIEPVEVTGRYTKYYDLDVEVTPNRPGGGSVETMGFMTYIRDGAADGHFSSECHGWTRLVFRPVDGGEPLIYDVDEQVTMYTGVDTPFLIPALHVADRTNKQEGPGHLPDEEGCCCQEHICRLVGGVWQCNTHCACP